MTIVDKLVEYFTVLDQQAMRPQIDWRGTPIEDLSREQLIDALYSAYHRINQLRDERNQAQATVAHLWTKT